MASGLFQFRWQVSPDVYRWEQWRVSSKPGQAKNPVEPLLITLPHRLETGGFRAAALGARPAEEDGTWFEYEPLVEYTGLFRIFAKVKPTEEGILEFAQEYGHLGIGQNVENPRAKLPTLELGERLAVWQNEIHAMQDALRVVEMLKGNDLAALNRHIVGPIDASVDEVPITILRLYDSHPDLEPEKQPKNGKRFRVPIAYEDEWWNEELEQLIRQGDAATAARAYLWNQVNSRLEEHTCTRLLFSDDGSRLGHHVNPKNLLGAVWLQLAQDIDSNRRYQQCEFCGNWFELMPRMRRRNTVYCSRSCRSAAYRDRQEQARRLRAKGKSFAAIAKQLGSDPETVRGWVEGRK